MGCAVAADADWHHVAEIVQALDGLPLAIEIVAAAARTEALADLARRVSPPTRRPSSTPNPRWARAA